MSPTTRTILTALLLIPLRAEVTAQEHFTVRSARMALTVSPEGNITGIGSVRPYWMKQVRGATAIDSCTPVPGALVRKTRGGGISFTRTFQGPGGEPRLRVVDRFTPDSAAIRWEIEIEGGTRPWSGGICTVMEFGDTSGARFWTTWGDPDQMSPESWGGHTESWYTPFETRPFRQMHLLYGGHFGKGAGYAIPGFSVMYPEAGTGISLFMSPADPLLEVHMETTSAGSVTQRRNFNRLEAGHPVRFTMLLFLHEADWRSALRNVVAHFPAYFFPPSPKAREVCGLGAYSSYEGEIDAEKYRAMGGIVNWKASFDFSYMGMFIPPVASDTTPWARFDATSEGDEKAGVHTYTTIARMARYATSMKALGFSTLNYFNITEFGGFSEFGKQVIWPNPHFTGAEDVWQNPTAFLYDHFPGAVLFGVVDDAGWNQRSPAQLMHMQPAFRDRPYWSWGGAIATDVGDSSYARFLLDQARLHAGKFRDAQGIAIDRFDWLNEYNARADDGQTWIAGRPVRSLLNSFRAFIPRLASIMHNSGKVVFCNPHMSRLDLMRWVDGVYTEFGHIGHDINLAAFLTPFKPLICWTPDRKTVMDGPDRFIQRHLLMGAFPTAPYPGNDHTIQPDSEVERYYLDYGRMFTLMHGREWVLLPGVLEVDGGGALANIFRAGNRVLVPVVMGSADTVLVRIRHAKEIGLAGSAVLETLYPGEAGAVTRTLRASKGELRLTVPLRRGCAFLVLRPA